MPLTAPAHWIRRNEVTRQPKCWVYLDTEARRTERPGFEDQTWRLGVTCHDHRHGGPDAWRPPEWAVHASPADLWAWVDARAKVGERCVVVAHNLAYDLRIADAFGQLPALGWELDRVRLDAEQTQCRWRSGKRTLLMVDTFSWLPVALETLGTELGIPKPDLPADDAPDPAWVERCVSDVTIMREAWRRIIGWLHDDDLGNWQPTGAGQAWAAWRHRFMDEKVLVGDDPELRELEREAVWAGRSEAWRHGHHRDGPYLEWDLQCAYLRIMRDCGVPVRLIGRVERPRKAELAKWLDVACVMARVEVDTDQPVAPAKGPHGIYWPVGRFETVVWDPELRLLLETEAKVKVLECAVYTKRPALSAFAQWLWPMATNETHTVDPIVHRVTKHWSRAFIGRFGVRYTEWLDYGATPYPQVGLQLVSDMTTGTTWRLLSVGDRCMREGELVEGENAVPSIMGWVMSETRARLWRAMTAAGLEHVLHVDTDGLLVDRDGSERLRALALDGLRVKQAYDHVEVLAPRQVIYGQQLRAPGVPRRSTRIGADTWRGESWQWLTSSLREGRPDRVRVAQRTIRLSSVDRRRAHVADGQTRAYVAGEVEP